MLLNSILDNRILLLITALLALLNYAFKAAGLYTMAKTKDIKYKWLAFVPVGSSYLLGKIAGEVNLFTGRVKNTALMLVIAHGAYILLLAAYNVLYYLPYIKEILDGQYTLWAFFTAHASDVQEQTSRAALIFGSLSSAANLAYIIMFISALFALFRKYEPERYMWYTIASVFLNIDGIFIFLVRNKKETDYNEYIRNKYARRGNPYGGGYNPFDPYNPGNSNNPRGGGGNPYGNAGGGNPYGNAGGNPYGNTSGGQSPFGEFSEPQNGSVFPEFENEKTPREGQTQDKQAQNGQAKDKQAQNGGSSNSDDDFFS